MRAFDNKTNEHTVFTRIESRFCIVGSPSHEFTIIAFYDEGAGLVAMDKQTKTSQCQNASSGEISRQIQVIFTKSTISGLNHSNTRK